MGGRRYATDREYIEANSMPCPPSSCVLWLGAISTKMGYGQTCRNRVYDYAHRLAYVTYKGPIPAGLVVRHTCDVTCCVNPDHLVLGTNKDNTADMISRGRWSRPPVSRPNRGPYRRGL